MGTGKSSAAITYMNEHPEKKFIYVTPYIPEATRIAAACTNMKFFEPQKLARFKSSKVLHTIDLVRRGENVATTHQAFRYYPQELLDMVREKKYTLIIDENVDVLEQLEEDQYDMQMIIDAGYIQEKSPCVYELVNDVYKGETHKELFRVLRSRDLIKVHSDEVDKDSFFYWQLPPDLITSFDEVYILTYMFKGQSLYNLLEMYSISYEYIGIDKTDGVFRFSETGGYVPEYVKTLKDKIHIVDSGRMNQIGSRDYSLSKGWFDKPTSNVKQLKNNIYNFFNNMSDAGYDERMWSTFKSSKTMISGKGYSKCFISFNKKATNEFRNKKAAAYCLNLFLHVGHKIFYKRNGVEVDEDAYALSNMVQWIWRSAIRDGEEIDLYVPSKRMRTLLTEWIEEVSKYGEV